MEAKGTRTGAKAAMVVGALGVVFGDIGTSRWRKGLFLATSVIAAEPADYFRLPRERTVFLGSQIEF